MDWLSPDNLAQLNALLSVLLVIGMGAAARFLPAARAAISIAVQGAVQTEVAKQLEPIAAGISEIKDDVRALRDRDAEHDERLVVVEKAVALELVAPEKA